MAAVSASTTQGSSPGLLARVFGVLVSPRETYAAVVARPKWFGVMAVVVLVMSISQGLFLSTEVGQDAVLDQQVRSMEAFGVNITDQMYAQMESRLAYAKYTTGIFLAIFVPIGTALSSGLLLGVFTMLLGGEGTFKQVYSISAHSGVVIALQQIFSMPLSYASGKFTGANLGVLVPMLEETSFVTRFLESIDLFAIWSAISLAIGLGVLYKRRTGGIAASFIGIYVLIALVIAFVRSRS